MISAFLGGNTDPLMFTLLIVIVSIAFFYAFFLRHRNGKLIEERQLFSSELKTYQQNVLELKEQLQLFEMQIKHQKELNTIQLSEINGLKNEVRKAQRFVDEADMLKSNFLANMSHEIRTPMNGILGFAQILQSVEVDREMQLRYLDIITHNGAMLVNLIDDIMDLSKIEAGQLAINKHNVNLEDLFFELYTFYNEVKFKQEKEHITIRLLNLNDDEISEFHTDGSRIRQVLSNLISNALKFTEKGIVEFGYINNKEERMLQFFVRDTGIGIPSEKLDIIFDRFRQVEEGSTRRYGGTGIGLYISKNIIDLLGGKMWVESKIGEGSKFYFNLPYEAVQQDDFNKSVFIPSKKVYDWKGRVFVIAEDIETNYFFIKSVLAETQATLHWARNGEEVVRICNEVDSIDVVLMDIQMPKLNGYEATTQIKASKPGIRIIAQTAYALPNDNLRCLEAGCDDYISKPINSHLLLEKIDQQIHANRMA